MISKGATLLRSSLIEVFGVGTVIKEEEVIGGRLRIDYYLPQYKLAFEYHGVQHKTFTEHFHRDRAGYLQALERDRAKIELCASSGIGLVVVWDDEVVSNEVLMERISIAQEQVDFDKGSLQAISAARSGRPTEDPARRTERLEKASEARREAYLRAKELKKNGQ